MKDILAIYLRTSLEDYGKAHQLLDQSCSIVNQRALIQAYLSAQEELKNLAVIEYTDDGFTGTNMDRPGFQDMVRDMERGRIACIIAKDLSRLGRSYLEVGEYLEKIFPAAGVRVITVTDGYDSQALNGATGGIAVGLRNLIYDSYSKDLSVKVRSAMRSRMEKGKFISHVPYGYQKSPEDKHRMIPDPETAPIVQEIFRLVLAGKTTSQIASGLNSRGILTPLQYKQHKLKPVCRDRSLLWSHATVISVLHNYKYTGAMVNHMRESRHLRDRSQRRTSPEEWIVTENAHEALVTQEQFKQANAMLRHPKKSSRKAGKSSDAVFYCGHCGRKLRKTYGKEIYFSCGTPSYQPQAACKGLRWSKTDLEAVLFPIYQTQLSLLGQRLLDLQKNDIQSDAAAFVRRMAKAEQEMDRCNHQKVALFEAYHDGAIDQTAYITQKAALTERMEQLRTEYAEMEVEHRRKAEAREKQKKDLAQLSDYLSSDRLPDESVTAKMYEAIDRVVVIDQQHLEVRWKFEDLFSSPQAEAQTEASA